MASESAGWACGGCGKTNETIMKERAEAVAEAAASRGTVLSAATGSTSDVVVPDELRLAYREDLGKASGVAGSSNSSAVPQQEQKKDSSIGRPSQTESILQQANQSSSSTTQENKSSSSSTKYISKATTTTTTNNAALPPQSISTPTRTTNINTSTSTSTSTNTSPPAWIDRAILGVFIALVFMLLRKVVYV